jgi:hypothetical protein
MDGITAETVTVGAVYELRARFQKFADCVEMPWESRESAFDYLDVLEEACNNIVSLPTELRDSSNDEDDDDDDDEEDCAD